MLHSCRAGLTWEVNPKRKFCVLWRLRFARTRFRRRFFRPYSNLQSSWNTTISLFLSTRTRWHHLRSNVTHMPKLCTTRNRSFRNSCVNPLQIRIEVLTDLSGIVESLISINSKLDQPEAAVGILKFAQFKYASLIDLQESWYEKLNRWEDALAGYERKLSDDIGTQTSSSSTTSSSKTSDLKSNRSSLNNVLGMMRCLDVLMQWQKLQAIADDVCPDSIRPQDST